MKLPVQSLIVLAFTSLLISGCKKEADRGNMTVKMTDAPGDYAEVNVDVRAVEVHYSNNGNWTSLPTQTGIYNLLDLQNNITTVLATGTNIPAGNVSQIRLILGSNNTVMLRDSTIYDLKIPSSEQSGIKINVNTAIPPAGTVTVTLDYDADKSVNQEGNGDYIMKPVIKVLSVQ
ncbi:MAG: starch-binding domain-like protein [Bacteroidota bacterium]|jgi:hypothetical protein|nr:starch-binding domain-like protein [Bacteroidota bacterium]